MQLTLHPLLKAVVNRKVDHVKDMLNEGQAQDLLNEGFILAITYDSIDFAEHFLKHGADLERCASEAMFGACTSKAFEAIQFLINHGVNIHTCDDLAISTIARYGSPQQKAWLSNLL